MQMSYPSQKLPKRARLKSTKSIANLFANGNSVAKFPLRMVWVIQSEEPSILEKSKMAVSVPKKKIKKAVHRNLLKRRIREAWRLNRDPIIIPEKNYTIEVLFIYYGNTIFDFNAIQRSMKILIEQLKGNLNRYCL